MTWTPPVYRRFERDPADRTVHWYLWVPRSADGPDKAQGIMGLNRQRVFSFNWMTRRWESDDYLFEHAFGPGSDPKILVDEATAADVARRFGTTLPDVSKEWPPDAKDFPDYRPIPG